MAKLSAKRLSTLFRIYPADTAKLMAKKLTAFGYSVSWDWVQKEVGRQLRGGDPGDGPSKVLDGWLKEGLD